MTTRTATIPALAAALLLTIGLAGCGQEPPVAVDCEGIDPLVTTPAPGTVIPEECFTILPMPLDPNDPAVSGPAPE